jgi:hypothetical protein
MDKLEIKQGSFIQQTQYFIPVEIDLSIYHALMKFKDIDQIKVAISATL